MKKFNFDTIILKIMAWRSNLNFFIRIHKTSVYFYITFDKIFFGLRKSEKNLFY